MTKNILIAWLVLILFSSFAQAKEQDSTGKISHVVLVWLKQPGDQKMRDEFVSASRSLNDLPGIISRHVGVVVPSGRKIVDDSFDVAVTVTLKDKAALKAYMGHPRHKKIVHDVLQPLVGKIVAYDFAGQ